MRNASGLKLYLTLVLLFIFIDVACDNYVYKSFNNLSVTAAFVVFFSLSVAQIIASPVQAGLSTYFGKKKSISFSLGASLVALLVIFLYLINSLPMVLAIVLAIGIKGFFGNTTPLGWAAIADANDTNFRFSFGLSTAAYPVAYFLIIGANKLYNIQQSVLLVLALVIISLILCLIFFKNLRDHNSKTQKTKKTTLLLKEIKESVNEIKNKHIRNALLAYMLWEISQYCILFLYIDFNITEFSSVAVSMLVGYLLTVVILKFVSRIKDTTMMNTGYIFSIVLFIPFLILFPFLSKKVYLFLIICYFVHASGNALLSSTIFSLLAKEKEEGHHAIVYGLMESSDTLAFFISALAVKLYEAMGLSLIYIILFSFLTVALSWFPYRRYLTLRSKIPE